MSAEERAEKVRDAVLLLTSARGCLTDIMGQRVPGSNIDGLADAIDSTRRATALLLEVQRACLGA